MKGDNYRKEGCLEDQITAIGCSKSEVIETFYIVCTSEVFISSCLNGIPESAFLCTNGTSSFHYVEAICVTRFDLLSVKLLVL